MSNSPYSSDIVLSKTDGSTNKIGLKLFRDAPNVPGGWKIDHVSPAPPRQVSDSANYQQQSPDIGLVLDQDSWHRGFGASTISRFGTATEANRARARYGYSDGVLAMFRGELTLGYLTDESDILIKNGRFENLDSTSAYDMSDYTTSNITLASTSTYVKNGDRGATLTATADGGYIEQTINSPTLFQSKKLFAHCYLRRISGSGNATLQIIDSAGTTSATAITETSAFTGAVTSRTIDGSASSIKVRILLSKSGDVFALDDLAVFPEGGATWTEPQEFGGNIYAGCGRTIFKWDDTNEIFNAVYYDAAYTITDLISFDGALYAGRGTSAVYLRSTDGTTWAAPATNTGNARFAEFFARARNASGDLALFKNRTNQISVSTDPSDTANWGSEIKCGDSDRNITNLFSANDRLYVGREDGLFQYSRTANKFLDLQPEANLFPDDSNFKAAQGRSGAIFAGGGDQSFFRIDVGNFDGSYVWTDLSYIFKAPAFRGFGGRVTALTQDRNNLFVALADDLASESSGFPYTFPFSFAGANLSRTIKLLSVRTQQEEPGAATEDVPHTVASFDVSTINAMGKFKGSDRMSLFVLGNLLNDDSADSNNQLEPRAFRIRMPIRNENPALNSVAEHKLSGQFYTPFINFNYPDINKSAIKLTLTGTNLSSNKTVTVFYKTDDDTDNDNIGWNTWGSDGIFSSTGQTVAGTFSSALVNFDRIRFKLVFATDEMSVSPRINSLVFHAAWNPIDYRRWTAVIKLTDKRSMQLRRVRTSTVLSTDVSSLETLRKEPFVQLQDPDGSTHFVNLKYQDAMTSSRVYATRGVAPDQTRLLTLEMTEVKTT
tara:strand:+ start:786 stop:3284 length:2499 start_codon:yes stop_codon:yes gene_type:complete